MGSDNAVLRGDLTSSEIPNILRQIYKDQEILTVGARFQGNGRVSVDFVFPEYSRTQRRLGHVSGISVTAAVVEGVVCAIDDAFLSGRLPEGATAEWYEKSVYEHRWTMLNLNMLFRQMLQPNTVATLEFEVISVDIQRFRSPRLSLRVAFKGFCSGETLWIVDPPKPVAH